MSTSTADTSTANRLLSLAAGVVQEFPPEQVIRSAATAGFDAVGLWADMATWNDQRGRDVRNALEDTGLVPLDIEVLWMMPGQKPDVHHALIDTGMSLGARNILCVSSEPDITDTKKRFEAICRRAEDSHMRVVIEFLMITQVQSLQQALEIVRDVGHPAGGVLIDTLHLQRTSSTVEEILDAEPSLFPYLQLCDAPLTDPSSSEAEVLDEALYQRLMPGAGELPLKEVLSALNPQLPVSLEIRSRDLIERFPDSSAERAKAVYEASQHFFENID